ncbi:MAG: hypothetical protein ABIF09_04910 [Gemmatimonadota bacterium]
MKAVILLSGLAGLAIFGPPVLKSRAHHHQVSVIVHELSHSRSSWDGQSECRFEAERNVRSPAGSVQGLRLLAGSGSLSVVGVEGLQEIQAVGRACASHEDFLGDIQLTSEMAGSTLVIETHHPDLSGMRGGNRYARLDLRIEVPAGLAAEIQDGSGEMTLSDLGSLMVKDGSGGLEIRGVSGFVSVEDGSGGVVIEDVDSDVEIHDSSGELQIRGVGGSLTLYDSSGEVDVQDVAGSVRVVQDSSGNIAVKNVGRDFIVERDGSGGIRYEAVGGSVNIPKKKRER